MTESPDGYHRDLVSELDGWEMSLIVKHKYKFFKENLEYSCIYFKIIFANLYGL